MALEMGSLFRRKPSERKQKESADPFRSSAPSAESSRAAPRTVMIDRGGEGMALRLVDRLLAFKLPLIGDRPINTQVQVLLILLGFCFFVLVTVLLVYNRMTATGTLQTAIVGDTLMHTQRLAKAAPNAVEGSARRSWSCAKAATPSPPTSTRSPTAMRRAGSRHRRRTCSRRSTTLNERWRASEAAASVIVANEKALIAFGDVISKINDASPRLQQLTEEVTALKLQAGAPPREIATAAQLVTLTQRLGKSANSLVAGNVANAEVALTLGRDINQFRDLTQALLAGSDALRLAATTDPEARTRLQELTRVYGEFQSSIAGAIGSLQAIVQSKEAELAILRDSEPLRQQVTELGGLYTKEQAARTVTLFVMAFFGDRHAAVAPSRSSRCCSKTRASARPKPRSSGCRRSASSRKPSAPTSRTRPPFFG